LGTISVRNKVLMEKPEMEREMGSKNFFLQEIPSKGWPGLDSATANGRKMGALTSSSTLHCLQRSLAGGDA